VGGHGGYVNQRESVTGNSERSLGDVHRAQRVNRDHGLCRAHLGAYAGGMDDRSHPAERTGLREQRVDGGPVGYIGSDRLCRDTVCGQPGRRAVEGIPVAAADHDDMVAAESSAVMRPIPPAPPVTIATLSGTKARIRPVVSESAHRAPRHLHCHIGARHRATLCTVREAHDGGATFALIPVTHRFSQIHDYSRV